MICMIFKSIEKENKKFFDEFYYIALNCRSFRKHPTKKARSATKYLVFLAILPEFCNAHYCELYFSPLYKRVLLCQEIFIFVLYNLVQ